MWIFIALGGVGIFAVGLQIGRWMGESYGHKMGFLDGYLRGKRDWREEGEPDVA